MEEWLVGGGPGFPARLEDLARRDVADKLLDRFVNAKYEEQHPDKKLSYSEVVDCVLAVQWRWKRHRGHLHQTWEALTSWRMELPINSRVPMPPRLLRGFVSLALVAAFFVDDRRCCFWVALAILMRTGYKGIMRPSEVGELRVGDVLLPRTVLGLRGKMLLRVRRPKTRRLLGRQQYVMIGDAWCIRWMRWLIQDLPDDFLVLPGGLSALREGMKLLSRFFQVEHLKLRPSSLRAGGATAVLEATGNVPALRLAGRWLNERSLEHYVQEAMVMLITQRVSGESEDLIAAARGCWRMFRTPPHLHWSTYMSRSHQIRGHLAEVKRALRSRGMEV